MNVYMGHLILLANIIWYWWMMTQRQKHVGCGGA